MGFFSSDKPKVSKDEFKKVRWYLFGKGWNSNELDLVTSFFSGSMDESGDFEKGLDKNEIAQGLETLKENERIYHLSNKKLLELEEALNKYL
jgi:hypothetical protein